MFEDLVDLDRARACACVSGIVLPSGQPRLEVPLVSSTYFRPSAERGRTMTVESIGSGLTVVSSFRPSSRGDRAVAVADGVDRVDDADARAAEAHLVALHQAARRSGR